MMSMALKPSKPDRCACGARHPNYSRDGGRVGTPWRCRQCDVSADRLPPADPFAVHSVGLAPQGSLL